MRPYTLSRIRGCASVRLGPKASAPFRLAAHAVFCGFALRKGKPELRSGILALMRNFSLYGGDRSPPISYMSCNSLSTSNCQFSKIKTTLKGDARENSKHLRFAFLMHLLLTGVSPSLPEGRCLLRKEVIQPLVPQRLPCYDFIPITTHTLGGQMPDFGCRRLS